MAYISLVEDRLHDSLVFFSPSPLFSAPPLQDPKIILALLSFLQLFLWWMEDENRKKEIVPLYKRLLSFPAKFYLTDQFYSKVQARLSYLKKKGDIDYLSEVYMSAKECYQSLSAKLGDKPYFFGDSPSTLDAVVFGHLAVHYYAVLPNNKLNIILSGFPNLVRYIEATKETYFASWSPSKGVFSPRKSPAKKPASPTKISEKPQKTPYQLQIERQRMGFLVGCGLFVMGYIFFHRLR